MMYYAPISRKQFFKNKQKNADFLFSRREIFAILLPSNMIESTRFSRAG